MNQLWAYELKQMKSPLKQMRNKISVNNANDYNIKTLYLAIHRFTNTNPLLIETRMGYVWS